MIGATMSVNARESVSIHVSPAVAFAPAELVIRTSIEPAADNRVLEIIADSNEFYRSSEIQLEGDRAPRTSMVQFHGVPGGEYDITAAVIGADGHPRTVARAHVKVIGVE
jgi:hypothetical protein